MCEKKERKEKKKRTKKATKQLFYNINSPIITWLRLIICI